jgi:hypothetical protein
VIELYVGGLLGSAPRDPQVNDAACRSQQA